MLLIDLILSQGKWIKVFGIMNLQMSYANLEEYKKTVEKQLKDADKKLAENLTTIQRLNRDKERKDKKIFDLEASARRIIEIVDPPQLGVADSRSVLERLKNVPTQIAGYMMGTSKYVARHVLGLIRSWYPRLDTRYLAEGIPNDCTLEQFQGNLQEVEPLVYCIVGSLDLQLKYHQ